MVIANIRFKIYFFFTHCIIFYIQCNFSTAKPILGHVTEASTDEFRYIVSLSSRNSSRSVVANHKCTGTLVSKQDILTSEHCVFGSSASSFQILLGSHDLNHSIKMTVLWWLSFDQWAMFRNATIECEDNDIAFVKLIGNVPYYVPFASVADADSYMFYGLEAQMAGWGTMDGDVLPHNLQKATIQIMTMDECEERIWLLSGIRFPMHRRRICSVSTPYALLYQGDSGGPLIFYDNLVGVNKGTSPLDDPRTCPQKVNLHYSAFFYRDFIIDIVNNFVAHF